MQIAYRRRPDLPTIDGRKTLTCPGDVVALLRAILETEPVEVFGLLCLTTQHRFLAYHELSRGSLDETVVHAREVFKAAMLANAAAIVLAHNHPSGDPTPSDTDLALTRQLAQAGELLGVEVVEHVIIGHDGRFWSFREQGLLPRWSPRNEDRVRASRRHRRGGDRRQDSGARQEK